MKNQLFFTRKITIQNNSNSLTSSSKQFVLPNLPLNNPDSLNSSSMITFANNPLNTSDSSIGREYKKFGFSHHKKSSSQINEEVFNIFQQRDRQQNDKFDHKASQTEKNKYLIKTDRSNLQKQISERAHTSKSQIDVSRINNQNSTSKQKQRLSLRPSLSKPKLKRLNFIKKKSFQTDNNCFSEKFSNQHQLNHDLPEQITTKKINRKLSINTMTNAFFGQLNPKNTIGEIQLKKITEHSIEATPSNKMNKKNICVTCGNFLINIQKIYEKSTRDNKKIKELFKDLKQEKKKITEELVKFKIQITRQVQKIGLQFMGMIKKTFRDENNQNSFNKIKTQQNMRDRKNREFYKLNRSAIFSSTDQQSISSFASRQRFDTNLQEKKWQKSQISSNSIGRIIKNYGSRKENEKKYNRNLQLQIIINKYEGKFKKNGIELLNYGRIVPNFHKKIDKSEKYNSPLTERLIKDESEFEEQRVMSKSYIQRQESYRECYNNIKEVLNKMKSIF